MGEQQKFMSRLGSWFRKSQNPADEATHDGGDDNVPGMSVSTGGPGNEMEPRNNFLRPWARRDHAIDNLQQGIGALSDLLVSIRENMEKQSQRQEELLGHLAGLPEALRAIPESGRAQGETLKAISEQMERQGKQQSKLGDILDRISTADTQHGRTLEALQQTVASLNEHDQTISSNMQSLGAALSSITGNSQTSAQVLEQLRDNTARRDGELERVIQRQNTRFTTLLTVAIVLSVAALTAVSIFGYLAYDALTKVK